MSRSGSTATINAILDQLRRRRRLGNTVSYAIRGLFYGAIVSVILLVIGNMLKTDWIVDTPISCAACIPVGMLLGAFVGLLWPVDDLRVARMLDHAAGSDDRFASAMQLAGHHRAERAKAVATDALSRVRDVSISLAIPLRAPSELRWIPVPVVLLLALAFVLPGPESSASEPAEPEVTAEQWSQLHEEFRNEMKQLPKAQDEEEKELDKKLEQLSNLIAKKPEKKEVLAAISKLRRELEEHRKKLGTRDLSVRKAATSIKSSESLKKFASLLQQGEYEKAAEELRKLAKEMAEKSMQMTAQDFEQFSSDFDRLAQQLSAHQQISQCCQQCSKAASSMNRSEMAEALRNLSRCLNSNCKSFRQSDRLCRSCSMLDMLKRRLSQCSGCRNGRGLVQCQGKKGGLRPGWGSTQEWGGGSLTKETENRLPTMADAQERSGDSDSFPIVSKEERSQSAQAYRESFADLVQKAEADLSLEMVPISYRDFLRRYFNAIRPPDESPTPAEPSE